MGNKGIFKIKFCVLLTSYVENITEATIFRVFSYPAVGLMDCNPQSYVILPTLSINNMQSPSLSYELIQTIFSVGLFIERIY